MNSWARSGCYPRIPPPFQRQRLHAKNEFEGPRIGLVFYLEGNRKIVNTRDVLLVDFDKFVDAIPKLGLYWLVLN